MRPDGSTTYSRDGSPVFGSFFGQSSLSMHAIAYADNCVVVDKSVDLTKVAPYGCGFQTGSGTVLNVLKPGPTDSLVVYGVGAVGLAAFAAAKHLQVGTIVAVDPLESRRDAAAKYGAVGIDPIATENVVEKVKELTGGGATYAIDTTAISAVVKQAQQSLKSRGNPDRAWPRRRGVHDRRARPAPDGQGHQVLDRGLTRTRWRWCRG
jgi:aryl-alcohol dehydrogenase